MAKKITEKITVNHTVKIEGTLNVDNIDEGVLLIEVEEEGEINLNDYIKKFGDKYITITLTDKTEETPAE